MFGEAGGGYVADHFMQTPHVQQFTPGEAARPPPLQLESQQFGPQDYMMPAQSSMMWPQTPHSFPPTPAAVPHTIMPQMYTGVSQTTSFVDVAHATWPQSNPYVPIAQTMSTPVVQQQSFQQAWYQQPPAVQPTQVQPRPNTAPTQQASWEEERRRQQALAHETRAKQQAWATEMQRHHLTYANQVPAVRPQIAATVSFQGQPSGQFSYQPQQPVASSTSSIAAPSTQSRSQAATESALPRTDASSRISEAKPSTPIKSLLSEGSENDRRSGAGSSSRPKMFFGQSRKEPNEAQASEKTPAKSRPTLSGMPSPTAKESTRSAPRGEAWEPPEIAPSPSGQSEKSWRRRGKFTGEWASVPVETPERSQDKDWGDWEEQDKVSQPGPKKVRSRGKFKAEGGSPLGSAASSPAHSSAKGRQAISWDEGHGRRRSQKDYEDTWYEDSWWYEGYEDTTYYSKGKIGYRKKVGR